MLSRIRGCLSDDFIICQLSQKKGFKKSSFNLIKCGAKDWYQLLTVP